MRPIWLIGSLAGALLVPAGAQEGGGDAQRLEGKWTGWVMEGTGDRPSQRRVEILEMVVTADKITARDRQRSMGEGTWRLDAKPQPGHLDADGTEGQSRGRKHLGIYKLEGDTLRWCVANPGRPRPTEFKTTTAVQFLMVMTRVK